MTTFTRASQEARYRAWQIATGKPWMGPDEVREQEGLPPDGRCTAELEPSVSVSVPPESPAPPEAPVGAPSEEGAVTA
jgi:hypothetical protein